MYIVLIILLLAAIFGIPIIIRNAKKKQVVVSGPMPDSYRLLLNEKVDFYKHLDQAKKTEFENRMQQFLSTTQITGVRTEVEDIDRVLIAAGAIIPIFGFADWEYVNLNEVLLYPDYFAEDFKQRGTGRDVLGMVGSGAMQNVMILSKQREGEHGDP